MSSATIVCPTCGTHASEVMPVDACQYFYRCTSCQELLKPLSGDCCVFCSYSDRTCPPKATEVVHSRDKEPGHTA